MGSVFAEALQYLDKQIISSRCPHNHWRSDHDDVALFSGHSLFPACTADLGVIDVVHAFTEILAGTVFENKEGMLSRKRRSNAGFKPQSPAAGERPTHNDEDGHGKICSVVWGNDK